MTQGTQISSPAKIILLIFLLFFGYTAIAHATPADQALKRLKTLEVAQKALLSTVTKITILKSYCISGTGKPTKEPTYKQISEATTTRARLIKENVTLEKEIKHISKAAAVDKLNKRRASSRITKLGNTLNTIARTLRAKKSALDKASNKDCLARTTVTYARVKIPSIPGYLCPEDKAQKQALIKQAKAAVDSAIKNYQKAVKDADKYKNAQKGQDSATKAELEKLFKAKLKVVERHRSIRNKAQAALKAAQGLQIVKSCDKSGKKIIVAPLGRATLKTPELLRPMSKVCDACKPEGNNYNRQVSALANLRNKIANLVSQYGAKSGTVPPKAAVEYKSLMDAWKAKRGLVDAIKQALDQCIKDKCQPIPKKDILVPSPTGSKPGNVEKKPLPLTPKKNRVRKDILIPSPTGSEPGNVEKKPLPPAPKKDYGKINPPPLGPPLISTPSAGSKLPFDWKGPYKAKCWQCEKLAADLNRLPQEAKKQQAIHDAAIKQMLYELTEKGYGEETPAQSASLNKLDQQAKVAEANLKKITDHFNEVSGMLKICEMECP